MTLKRARAFTTAQPDEDLAADVVFTEPPLPAGT